MPKKQAGFRIGRERMGLYPNDRMPSHCIKHLHFGQGKVVGRGADYTRK